MHKCVICPSDVICASRKQNRNRLYNALIDS